MKNCFTRGILLLAIVLVAGNCLAAEEGSAAPKSDGLLGRPSTDWNSQLSVDYFTSAGLQNIPADAGITDYRIKLLRNIKINNDWTLSTGGGYGLKHIDTSSIAALPQDLHALFLEVGAKYRINERSFASLRLTPGFYSDFKDLGGDDLRIPVLALGGYSFENGFSVVGGFIYRLGYQSSSFIPAMGFSYQPNPYWRFDAIAPRPGITYIASRQLQMFVAGDFASDEYELHDQSIGAKAIKYSDYKAMAGFNYLPNSTIKLSTFVGYAFERKFLFYDSTRPDLRVENVPFFKVSLDYGW